MSQYIVHPRAPAVPPKQLPWYRHLNVQVLVAIAAGVLIGHFAPETGKALKPVGDASSSWSR